MFHYLVLLFNLTLSQNNLIMEQGESSVPLSDLDAYVYLLEPDKRAGFINDKVQIEKNIITMMNINIVNDYLKSKELLKHPAFNNVTDIVNKMPVTLDDEFYMKLGLDKESSHQSVKNFIIKKELFVRMSDYIEYELNSGQIDKYIKEQFLLNSSKYLIPEKRDISLIELDKSEFNPSVVKEILTDLLEKDDFKHFSEQAIKYSSDKSVKLNQGHLKTFRQADFKYPFSKSVFSSNSIGVIPNIFKYSNNYFLIRINEIIPEVKPIFEDHKDEIIESVLPELVDSKLQNIINTQAKNKIKVNPEVLAHVFERYKVLIEE